jgi:hypothetical protein
MARTLALVLGVAVGLACSSSPTGQEPGGLLDYDGLLAGLRRGGAAVSEGGPITQPFFATPGRSIVVAGDPVQVFEFPDAAEARANARRVSPDGDRVGTSSVFWVAPPHFFVRGRVLALSVGGSAPVLTRLSAVMGPQFAGR